MILATHGIVGSQITQFVGLLDTYSGAAAAYSLRKLRTAYTGSAIRVRRASDNSEQDIGFVNNQLDTSTLTSFCSGTNGFVKTWYDQSGNGNDATQTTAANQPKIVNAGSTILDSNKPSIQFISPDQNNGTSLSLQNQVISGNSFSLFSCANFDNITNYEYLFSQDSGVDTDGFKIRRFSTQNTLEFSYLNSFIRSTTFINEQRLISFVKAPSTGYGYINNNLEGQFNNSSNIIGTQPTIGARTLSPILPMNGKIQEIIIYASDQSSNRTGISNNINSYYSIY